MGTLGQNLPVFIFCLNKGVGFRYGAAANDQANLKGKCLFTYYFELDSTQKNV